MKEEVLKLLKEKNIEYDIVEHEKVYTIEDMEKLHLLDLGCVCKNLFLRNAKGNEHYLVSCSHEKQVRMDELAQKIDSTRLSFGSAERLSKYLKLEQGYVSPFGVINDDSKSVIFIFDKELLKKGKIGFHPNMNDATIFVSLKDVIDIIESNGNEVRLIEL